jgi:hypothetical protein
MKKEVAEGVGEQILVRLLWSRRALLRGDDQEEEVADGNHSHAQVSSMEAMASRRRRVQQLGTGKKRRWRRLFWRRRKMGRVCWDAVVAQGERGAGG